MANLTATGWCAVCKNPLLPGRFAMVRGRKTCNDCINKEAALKKAKQNDLTQKDFFDYLLSFCPNISQPPESWYAITESMLKKGWLFKGLRNTLTYCNQQGLKITSDNWSMMIYTYYGEAVAWVEKIRQQQEQNKKVDLKSNVVTVPFKSTSYRDMPNYKMEDL